MKNLFVNAEAKFRNGWWVLLFIATLLAVGAPLVLAAKGLRKIGFAAAWFEPTAFAFTLAATWICVALRRESLASVGFRMDRRWAMEFVGGTLLGCGVMLLAALLVWSAGGVQFALDPARSGTALLYGLYLFLCVSLFEETLFRGFLFQRMKDGLGTAPTQALLAVFFALAHWSNPGMVGATRAWATLSIGLAAVFLGLAYLRTGSLALPIGIHLGWNWTQGNLLGFGVSGTTGRAGWLKPVFQEQPEWITGGVFGLEASVCGVIAVLLGIGLLWARKPVSAAASTVPAPADPRPGSA